MDILTADIALPERVVAFFTTRGGGVSDPPYHSLNLSVNVGDELDAVQENRIRLREQLPDEPMWLRQAHGNRVLRAENITRDSDVADAMVTTRPDVVCAVQTADCLPVLFYAEDAAAVAAAHAGWRGLAAGILENTVTALRQVTASALHAYIGPAIGTANFVVGPEVVQALQITEADTAAFRPHAEQKDKWHADLSALASRRLKQAGVVQVHTVPLCTYDEQALLFSARRRRQCGRQAGVIYLAAAV